MVAVSAGGGLTVTLTGSESLTVVSEVTRVMRLPVYASAKEFPVATLMLTVCCALGARLVIAVIGLMTSVREPAVSVRPVNETPMVVVPVFCTTNVPVIVCCVLPLSVTEEVTISSASCAAAAPAKSMVKTMSPMNSLFIVFHPSKPPLFIY